VRLDLSDVAAVLVAESRGNDKPLHFIREDRKP
jgi:hypothetical protein